MSKRKKPTADQLTLFKAAPASETEAPQPAIAVGDVVEVITPEHTRRLWIVAKVIDNSYAVVWHDTEMDCVPIAALQPAAIDAKALARH